MSKSLIADFFRQNVVLNVGAPAETPTPNTSVAPTRQESEQIEREVYGMYPQSYTTSSEFQKFGLREGSWKVPYDKPAYWGRDYASVPFPSIQINLKDEELKKLLDEWEKCKK